MTMTRETAYKIDVRLKSALSAAANQLLKEAILKSMSHCVAGSFDINAEGSLVTFCREADVDADVIAGHFNGNTLFNIDQLARVQLAGEFEDTRPTNEHLLEIVATLRDPEGQVTVRNAEALLDLMAERRNLPSAMLPVVDGDCGNGDIYGFATTKDDAIFVGNEGFVDPVLDAYPAENVKLSNGLCVPKAWVATTFKRNPLCVELIDALAGAEGAVSINDGLLWFEHGKNFDLKASKESLELLQAKAKALDELLASLKEAGFDSNDRINAGDCVETVDGLYQDLIKRFPQP